MATTHHSKQTLKPRRPHFSPRQLLTSQQLNQSQAFQLESLRRALQGLAGTGVVYGYSLLIEKNCIQIDCGLAFDCYGRQLYWSGGTINLDDLVGEKPNCAGQYTLCVHYAERHAAGSSQSINCSPCEPENDEVLWVDQCVVFSLKQGCAKKPTDCEPWDGCPDINDYVCKQLKQLPCNKDPGKLTATDCDYEYYDSDACIPLGCVEICDLSDQSKDCDPRYGFCATEPVICDYRPFVYRNELLYQLIRGDHLNYTRVASLSWEQWTLYTKAWEEQIPWNEFVNRVKLQDGFEICFSQPVKSNTLHPGSIILSAVIQDARTDYWETRRIPLTIELLNQHGDCTDKIRLKFNADWFHCEITDARSTLEYGVTIELTIRGSLIRDKCGCMLDAQPLADKYHEHDCCQACPGGDFIALFRVAAKEKEPDSITKIPDKLESVQQDAANK